MLIAIFIAQLVAVVIGSLIGALVLRGATKFLQKLEVPYGHAYLTVLLPGLINVVLGSFVGFVVGSYSNSMGLLYLAFAFVLTVGFFIQSGIIRFRLEIPFGRACLVTAAMAAIGIGLVLIIYILIVLIVTLNS